MPLHPISGKPVDIDIQKVLETDGYIVFGGDEDCEVGKVISDGLWRFDKLCIPGPIAVIGTATEAEWCEQCTRWTGTPPVFRFPDGTRFFKAAAE